LSFAFYSYPAEQDYFYIFVSVKKRKDYVGVHTTAFWPTKLNIRKKEKSRAPALLFLFITRSLKNILRSF